MVQISITQSHAPYVWVFTVEVTMKTLRTHPESLSTLNSFCAFPVGESAVIKAEISTLQIGIFFRSKIIPAEAPRQDIESCCEVISPGKYPCLQKWLNGVNLITLK